MGSERLAVTGVGLCTPLGPDPVAAIDGGGTAVRSRADLAGLPDDRSAEVERIDLRPWLKRRKDRTGFGATPVPTELISPVWTITGLHTLAELHQEEQQHDALLLERPFSLKVRFVHDVSALEATSA